MSVFIQHQQPQIILKAQQPQRTVNRLHIQIHDHISLIGARGAENRHRAHKGNHGLPRFQGPAAVLIVGPGLQFQRSGKGRVRIPAQLGGPKIGGQGVIILAEENADGMQIAVIGYGGAQLLDEGKADIVLPLAEIIHIFKKHAVIQQALHGFIHLIQNHFMGVFQQQQRAFPIFLRLFFQNLIGTGILHAPGEHNDGHCQKQKQPQIGRKFAAAPIAFHAFPSFPDGGGAGGGNALCLPCPFLYDSQR